MIPLLVGTINRSERYHITAVDDLIDMADPILMIEVVDFLPGHASAIPLTA